MKVTEKNDITLNPTSFTGEIPAIASKSHAHRMLICAALSDKITKIRCTTTNADIEATAGCLRGLGAEITREGEYFIVNPIKEVIENAVLDCGESGSTMRFLLPVVLALGRNSSLLGHGRLPDRPLSPLYEELIHHGADIDKMGTNPLGCRKTITAGEYTIDGGVSSQFISGLLFALPLLESDSTIRVTGKIESRPYIDMTLDAIRLFGITVDESENGVFTVKHGKYVSPESDINTEGDWSNAAFWLCAGAMSDKGVTVTNLNLTSLQGDKRVCDILSDFGAEVNKNGTDVTVRKVRELSGITFDASNIPDLVPVLAITACSAVEKTVITGCARLRLKESDRIMSVCNMVSSLGGKCYEGEDSSIVIEGTGKLSGGTVDSVNDHRIAMSASIASAISDGDIKIIKADAVNKSYPSFYEDYDKLMQN